MQPKTSLSTIVIDSRIQESRDTIAALDSIQLSAIIDKIEPLVGTDRTIFIAGNGGSATTAAHWVCDLSKVILGDQPYKDDQRLRIISLADSMSLVTAISNDISYDRIFAEQFENLAKPGDLLIVLSYSGNSKNILEVLKSATERKVQSIALLGKDGGHAKSAADVSLVIPSNDCGIVEDLHLIIGHMITHYFKVKNGYSEI